MRLLFSFFIIFNLTACMSTPEISSTQEKTTSDKILNNKTTAQEAKDEYKKLQAQRDSE